MRPVSPATWLYTARALRDFGDGFVAVLLPAYLLALGFTPFQVGVIATAAIGGASATTLAIGILGARFDHRELLLAAAALMVMTGAAYAAVTDYAVLLVIAVVGTINPSGGAANIFTPLEHAVLAREVSAAGRTHAFARYSLYGSLAGALGALAAATPDLLAPFGIGQIAGIKLMFIVYALLGIVGGFTYAQIPPHRPEPDEAPRAALGPSRVTVYKLAALFSLDSFASGFAIQSLMALWLFEQFGLSLSAASVFFFWSSVFTAISFPIAAWLSRHIGLVNTMVFTHIPANLCLILAAFAPTLPIALGLLLVRSALAQMDVPARSSYVMAVVTPPERAAAASFTAVPRSLALAASPALAGAIFAAPFRGWPLIICGALKIVYDLLLLFQFRHVKPPEEA
jgi:MFS family permease